MIRTSTLPNGLLVLTESMIHVRSATIGVWADVGSSYEPAGSDCPSVSTAKAAASANSDAPAPAGSRSAPGPLRRRRASAPGPEGSGCRNSGSLMLLLSADPLAKDHSPG